MKKFLEMLTEEMHTQNVVFEERQVLKVNRKLHGIIVKDAEDAEDTEDAEDSCVKSVFYAAEKNRGKRRNEKNRKQAARAVSR